MSFLNRNKLLIFLLPVLLAALGCRQSEKKQKAQSGVVSIIEVNTAYFQRGDYRETAALADSVLNSTHQPPKKAEALLYLAETNISEGSYQQAYKYISEAASITKTLSGKAHAATVELLKAELAIKQVKPDEAQTILDNVSPSITATDSASKYRLALDRTELSSQKNEPALTDSLTRSLLNTSGISLYRHGYFKALAMVARIQYINQNGNPDSALFIAQQLGRLIDSTYPQNACLQTLRYRSLCRSALGLIDYETSVKNAQQELYFAKKSNNATLVFYAYYDMQQARNINQDLKSALIYADSAELVLQKYFPAKSLEATLLCKVYTSMYRTSHDFAMAKYYAGKSIALDSVLYGKSSEPLARAYLALGNVYSDMGKFDSMVYYTQKSLAIRRANFPPGALQVGLTLDDLARVYNNMDKPGLALPLQKEVEQIYRKNYGPNHSYMAWAYDAEADSYGQLKQYDKAIEYSNKALGVFIPNMATDTGAINRTAAIPFDIYLPDYFTSRIQIYFNHSLHTEDKKEKISYLLEGYRISVAANKYIQSYASHFDSPESVAVIYQRMYDCYKMCADLCYRLYILTGEEKYREAILEFSENKRGAFLRSGVLGAKFIHFSGMPDSILKTETRIRNEITAAMSPATPQTRKDSLNVVYEHFLQQLAKTYADYYRLKYLPYQPKERQVQDWLPNDSTVFAEYLFSMEKLYILVITKNKASVIALDKKDSITDKLTQLSGMLRRNDVKTYYQAGCEAYNYFVKPIESYIKPGSRVIICADGPISTLNFEALPMRPRPDARKFYREDFLMNRYNFSYAVSAFSLLNNFSKSTDLRKKDRVYFSAPGFDDDQKERYKRFAADNHLDIDNKFLNYLYQPFMSRLGSQLAKTWKITFDEGSSATESNFKEKCGGNNVVQVGSHALLNDVDPMKSCLVFTKELSTSPKNDGYLYLPEIYDQKINADLVVLTACETGGGQFKEGEGMMSLSYGFQYAGCKSAVMSLWPIDEKASAAITQNFYAHLAKGENASTALWHAKKDFLKTADNMQDNPFYWSGLVLMGQDTKIQLAKKSNGLGYYLVMVLVAGGVVLNAALRNRGKRSGVVSIIN